MMFRKTPGQMTIEFVVAFPAMIAVAFVAITLSYFSLIAPPLIVCSGMRYAPMPLLQLTSREQARVAG